MKQLMVAVFMVSFVASAEHPTRDELNAEQVQQAQVQAGPVGAALTEIKNALRQPDNQKVLAWVASIASLHLIPLYGEWCPEAVFMMGLAKYMALTPVCLLASGLPLTKPHLVDMCVLGSFVALCSVFWYQYADIFWGIQEWAIERSGGKYRGIIGNLGTASAERLAIYLEWGGRGKK